MKTLALLGVGVGLFGTATLVAFAQTNAVPPAQVGGRIQVPDSPPVLPEWIHSREPLPGMPFLPPPPPKGAFFHLRRGDAEVAVKCADDEPMKACIEAADQLLDKVTTSTESTP
jgi:hypothetical protein